tara:strand:- start:54 stop:239 length:186 start_codon:yes stop_codon:yes gene_type:complete
MDEKITVVLKVSKETRDKLKQDAKKHFRSTTMHVKAIIANYLNKLSLPKDDYHDSDMSNLT